MRFEKLELLIKMELKKYIMLNSKHRALVFILYIILLLAIESTILMSTFLSLNNLNNALTILGLLALFVIFSSSSKNIGESFFADRELNILIPLPFTKKEIIISKLLSSYVYSLGITFVFLIIPTVIFNIKTGTIVNYIMSIICLMIFPIVPFSIGIIISNFTGGLLKKSKFKRLINSIINLLILVIIYSAFYIFRNIFFNFLFLLINNENSIFYKILFSLKFLKDIIIYKNILSLIFFILISLVIFILTIELIIKNITISNTNSFENKNRNKFISKEKNRNFLQISLKKEFQLILNNSNYFLNSIFFPFMIFILSILFIFMDKNLINNLYDQSNIYEFIHKYLIYLILSPILINNTTYCSLSIEGKALPSILTLPISKKQLLLPKFMLGMFFHLPIIVISSLIFSLKYSMGLNFYILLSLTALVASICSNLCGILYDIYFLKINWTNEREISKGRLSTILMALPTSILALISIIISNRFRINDFFILLPLYTTLSIILFLKLKNKKIREL